MKGGQCTDDFTAEIIMSRLFPIPQAYWVCLLLFSLIAVAATVRIIPAFCTCALSSLHTMLFYCQ